MGQPLKSITFTWEEETCICKKATEKSGYDLWLSNLSDYKYQLNDIYDFEQIV